MPPILIPALIKAGAMAWKAIAGKGVAAAAGKGVSAAAGKGLLSKLSPLTKLSGLSLATGAAQSMFSGRKKLERELLDLEMPIYERDKGVLDYYQKSLNRANESLTSSPIYTEAQRSADRVAATALGGMQDRRSALDAVNKIAGMQQEGLNQAGLNVMNEQNRRFRELGSATQMQNRENIRAFDINKMQPFQRKDQIARLRLAAANARADAGAQNIASAGQLAYMSSRMGKD